MNTPSPGHIFPVEQKRWGAVDGKQVWLFTCRTSSGSMIRITNYGAVIQSLLIPDVDDTPVDVVLGYDSLEEYIHDPFYIGAVVGRFSNRINRGVVTLEGKKYALSMNREGFHQHGGFSGFNKKVWDATPFSVKGKTGATLRYTSPHLEEGFPGNLTVAITYSLTDDNVLSVDFRATTDQPTVINLTQHSYFNLAGNGETPITNHHLQLFAPWYLPATEQLMPEGSILETAGTPFDFAHGKAIGKDIGASHPQLVYSKGYDHYFVLEKEHSRRLKNAGLLSSHDSGIQMMFRTTEPGFHFYSGNFLAASFPGKNNEMYHTRNGLCLETHHFPDAPNHPHFPTTVLLPGDTYDHHTEFAFSRSQA